MCRRRITFLVPGFTALIVTAFTDIAPVNPGATAFLFWTPGEVGIWGMVVGIGFALAVQLDLRTVRMRLQQVKEAEDKRRTIAAIGVAASWDLDLSRLYHRISQDLRSILEFDRLTITTAQPTGHMKVEYVSGNPDESLPVGSVLVQTPAEPDGLLPELSGKYLSRLTSAIPACNGAITLRSRQPGAYRAEHLDLLRQAVAQISPGIANAILFRASERRVNERTVLADIGRASTSVLEPRAILEAVDASLAKLIDYDHLGVILADKSEEPCCSGTIVYWSKDGLAGRTTGERVEFDPGSISKTEVVSTAGVNPAGIGKGMELEAKNSRTWLQAPLVVQEQLIGTMVLSSSTAQTYDQEESALLLNVSLQIAPAIQNAILTESLKRQSDERRAIAAIGLAANEELKLNAIYRRVADELAKVVDFDRMSITYRNEETQRSEIVFVQGISVDGFAAGDSIELLDMSEDGPWKQSRDWSNAPSDFMKLKVAGGLQSRTSAVLGTEPNELGAINIASVRPNAYDAQTTEFLERVAIQITPAIRNARMIAAERELRETLDRQNQELYEANNARKQFLSSVSHELKTPLTIISGFIDLLESPEVAGDEEQRVETLSIVRRNANQLDVLINDILDISRLDAGTFKINPAPFAVNELVADLQASFQSLLRTKAQTLRVNTSEDESWINADGSRISQVITNLLSNASKYSPEETEITLSCKVEGERLHVAISDQGIGMTEEEQEKLFTAFFRVDNETTRKVSGTGLGLVIAKSITELHGGEIRLGSKPGRGTTIEFWLPGIMSKEDAAATAAPEQVFTGSRLWPDGPPEDMELGAD